MYLTKEQIQQIKRAYKKAERAEQKFSSEIGNLASIITSITGVDGHVDYMMGDGFGFTPLSDDNTHSTIDELIELAEDGVDITEKEILDHLVI